MLHLEVERLVADKHRNGCLDEDVINCLLPNGSHHPFESFLFDYKFFISSPSAHPDPSHQDQLIRDFVSFYNSMGGYILSVFDAGPQFQDVLDFLANSDELNQRVQGYLDRNIGVRTIFIDRKVEGLPRKVALTYIPKRPLNVKPRPFIKNSRNIGTADKPKFIIQKGSLYCRFEHECKPANNDIELLNFLFSDRDWRPQFRLDIRIENNLPPRDPNLIQFVGRKQSLEALWNWITESKKPIRVLTAAGGLGKTTVAFEFASQLLDRPGAGLDKIVWLSGKKITYASTLGKLVPTTRCDFESVDDLLDNFLIQVGFTEQEVFEAADRDEKVSKCIEAFTALSILLVIDDVDSLEKEEQNELFYVISHIIISSSVHNDNSRVLFTSRLELLTGKEQRITLQGFEGAEFEEYLSVNVDHLIDDPALKKSIMASKEKILDASGGSPIFITSIVRLVSLGHDVRHAVTEWRGKNGEQIRAFAFEREIAQLTAPQKEILYALQLLSRARVEEIKDICGLTSVEIEHSLATLKEYHLYATKGDPIAGTILEVPEPIRLMHDITRNQIPEVSRKKIEHACLHAKKNNEDPVRRIALIVSQTVKHWKNNDHEVAEKYLGEEIAKYNKTGELYCLRGRTRLSIRGRRPSEIERDFEAAEKYGCNTFDLLKYWYILKIRSKDWRGLYNLHMRKRDAAKSYPIFNCCHVFAAIRIADGALETEKALQGIGVDDAIKYYKDAMECAFQYIENDQAVGYFHHMRGLMHEAAEGVVRATRLKPEVDLQDFEVLDFVASCVDYKFAPTHFIRIGLQAAEKCLPASRRRATLIANALSTLRSYLDGQVHKRKVLIAECDRLLTLVHARREREEA